MDTQDFPKIHQFATGEIAIFSNAYIVEGKSGLVVIDSTLAVSTAKELRVKVDKLNKPLLAVLLTHGHPDHYNGVVELIRDIDVPVIATDGVDKVIRQYDEEKTKQWKPVFKDEWPEKRAFPTKIVHDGETLIFDDMKFTVHDLGPGESFCDSYWILEAGGKRYAFIGDEVLNGVHAYMTDGHSTEWLKHIEQLKHDLEGVEKLYPGHGDAGDISMLDWQKSYLEMYRKKVKQLAQNKLQLTDDQKKELQTEMMAFLPSNKLSMLIQLGADPVAKELVKF